MINKPFLIGYDLGSSSIKVSLLNAESGNVSASLSYPKSELAISAPRPSWAEQNPDDWWINICAATKELLKLTAVNTQEIAAVGIAYQMHGLVLVDKNHKVLRPTIIWCDSRAVEIGKKAEEDLSPHTLKSILNSPGNFTASKLRWVKENEPQIYSQIYKFMLPGDYIALKMTGNACTTRPGLSEGIFWDFSERKICEELLKYYQIEKEIFPETVETFSNQGEITQAAAKELGLIAGIPVCYRAGDQPNNAFSLNVLEPGEVAATAGTSGVVYGVSDKAKADPKSRVNTFLHVNDSQMAQRLGVLLCLNGTGILNSWMKKIAGTLSGESLSYKEIDSLAAGVSAGSDGISILPFGNGAERILENKLAGCSIHGLDFNLHDKQHLFRAAQEGIVFALKYGTEIMKDMGVETKIVRAGKGNMFQSQVFCDTFSAVTGAVIEILDTDGSQGAARGAGIGCGIFKNTKEAFLNLKVEKTIEPNPIISDSCQSAYLKWKDLLLKETGDKYESN